MTFTFPSRRPHWGRLAVTACLVVLCLHVSTGAQPAEGEASDQADPHRVLDQVRHNPMFQRWERRQARAERQSTDQSELGRYIGDLVESWLQRLEAWLREHLDRDEEYGGDVSAGVGGAGLGGLLHVAGWIAIIVLGLFIAAVVIKLIMEGRSPYQPGDAVTRQALRDAMETGDALAANDQRWLNEADALADEQDLRAAYRALYLALLSGLHTRQHIDFRRQRTNWTYVLRFRGPTSDQGRFTHLTRLFDDIWYGLKPPSRSDMPRVRADVDHLLRDAQEAPDA